MASARDDITLGPVLEEISSQPNSSSTSGAVGELPSVSQLLKNIDSERTIIDSSRVSPNRGGAYIETATHAAAYLIAAHMLAWTGTTSTMVLPRHGAAQPFRTFLLSTIWYGDQPWHTVKKVVISVKTVFNALI